MRSVRGATITGVYSSDGGDRRALGALPWLAYPLAVWAGLAFAGTRATAGVVLAALAVRCFALLRGERGKALRPLLLPIAAAGVPAAAAAAADDPLLLLFAPVLVSLGLLGAFGYSLLRGPPLIETVARLQVGELSEPEIRYCRTVTAVWCVFVIANGATAGWLALSGSLAVWALWTGALAYLAVAVLFAIELTVRSWRFRHYGGGPGDALMRRLFPPRV
jgi:uncharacterized membrane protein